jgi:stage II sporulation protein AA (anti-sigma F factor antagonist)
MSFTPPAGPATLNVAVQRRDGVAIVQPRGDLDLATVDALQTALNGIDGVGRLVLDLRGLGFIDSSGVQLLVTLHHRAQRDELELSVIAPTGAANRAIELCGLDKTLPFAPASDVLDGEPGHSSNGSAT